MTVYANVFAGNNRGGQCLVETVSSPIGGKKSSIHFVDPKPARSRTLGRHYGQKFPSTKATYAIGKAEETVASLEPRGTMIWSADTAKSLSLTMKNREIFRPQTNLSYQIMGQGGEANSVRFGLVGLMTPEDHHLDAPIMEMMDFFDEITEPRSSRQNASVFQQTFSVFRPVLSQRHAIYLEEAHKENSDRNSFTMSISFGTEIFPLVPIVTKGNLTWNDQTTIAKKRFSDVPAHQRNKHHVYGQRSVVGLVNRSNRRVQFFKISSTATGKRRIDGITEVFVPKKPVLNFTD